MERQVPVDLVEYHEAFGSLRAAKNWMWWLTLLAVLVNLAVFVAVRFWPVLDESPSYQADVSQIRRTVEAEPAGVRGSWAATQPAATEAEEAGEQIVAEVEPTVEDAAPEMAATTQPAAQERQWMQPVSQRARCQEEFYQNLAWILPVARTLGLICALLMAVVLVASLHVSLSGRLGGAGYLASAFVWSILLAAIFVPWNLAFVGVVVPGVFFDRQELVSKTAVVMEANVSWMDLVLYYARFIGYPVLALMIWLAIQVKYARGYSQVAVEPPGK